MKTCRCCRKELPVSAFNKQKRAKDGLQAYCRICQKTKAALHYSENKAHHQLRKQRYRLTHREHVCTLERAQHQKHRERRVAYNKQWREANPERRAAQHIRHYRRYHAKKQAYAKQYAADHPDAIRRNRKKWSDKNPLKRREYKHRRRSREYATRTDRISYQNIWERDQGNCYLCGQPVTPPQLSFDHVVPLSRGGTHTEENIRVAHLRCNKKKGTKLLSEME